MKGCERRMFGGSMVKLKISEGFCPKGTSPRTSCHGVQRRNNSVGCGFY
jgi:hypothetical protein